MIHPIEFLTSYQEARPTLYDMEVGGIISQMKVRELDNSGDLEATHEIEEELGSYILNAWVTARIEKGGRGLSYMDSGHIVSEPGESSSSVEVDKFMLFRDGEEVALTSDQENLIIELIKLKLTVI